MNLIQSICGFFSSRCASGAADQRKAGLGITFKLAVRTLLRHRLVPQRLKPKSRVAVGLELATSGHYGKQTRVSGRLVT